MKHQLDFEKPIFDLQRKLDDLKKHPETHSINIAFEEEVALIEKKIEETKREIYANLSPWDRVKIARHPLRPFTLDYLNSAFTEFSELHGDRLYADDEAVAEASESLTRAEVQPGEEDAGEDEMPDEVEEVHGLDEIGHFEEDALQRLLPGEVSPALEVDHPLRVRVGSRPVRRDQVPKQLIDLESADDDQDLVQPVPPPKPRPRTRHAGDSTSRC